MHLNLYENLTLNTEKKLKIETMLISTSQMSGVHNLSENDNFLTITLK